MRIKMAKATMFLLYIFSLWYRILRGSDFIRRENYVIPKKEKMNITSAGCKKVLS
jgi:hypothetical protein